MQLVQRDGQNEAYSVSRTVIDPSEENVLFAFAEVDRVQFFPLYRNGFPGAGNRKWFNTGGLPSYEKWVESLEEFAPTVLVTCWSTPPLPETLLLSESFPLRYICHAAGTVRHKVSREFIAKGGLVTNWGSTISHNVAEHALLLILASLRNFTQWRQALEESDACWSNAQALKTCSMREKKVGIHGFGNVARELIRLLAPFDAECLAYSQNVAPSYIRQHGATPCADLNELFKRCEIVVECEGLTEDSTGSVREEHLRLLPEGGVFVNVARGSLVDEKALEQVAAEGRIRIGLDVFEIEPLPRNSPLRNLENVIISPHIAGPTSDWFHRCGTHALNNLERYLKGESLTGIVTIEVYDRST